MRAALILATSLAAAPAAAGPREAAPAGASRPNEVALRYYAAEKRTDRVEAEIARIRRLHPGWQPPADLWTATPGGEDEGPLWDLLATGRPEDLRAALAERARAEPGWRPSTGLRQAIARRDLRRDALALAKAGRWTALATLGDARRADLAEADAETAWAAAEAYARTERAPDASAALRRVLEDARFGPEERRVSVLRAMAFLPMAEVDRLVALGQPGDFDGIRIDLIRGRISAVLHDEVGQAVPAADLAAFEAWAESATDPNQPALVAWLSFKQRDFPAALTWFKRAIARGGDAMVAHGLAHTLRELGLRREAEEVAYAWREPLVNNQLLFIDLLEGDLTRENPPAIEPARLRRYAEVTAQTASGEGAQGLAWYAYNTCQFDTALSWFRRAVAWFPKEATVFGYALTLRRLHQQRSFVEVVNRYDGLFPKVVGLLFQASQDHPMPCEQAPARVAAPAPAQDTGYLDLAAPVVPAGQRGRVPMPDELGAATGAKAVPLVRRSEFPVMVSMENDLRVAAGGADARFSEPRWPERPSGRSATVARRVPGVGPMPYERFGFSLLPAFNGDAAASAPTAAERPAPHGSLWSDMHADRPPTAEPGSAAGQVPAATDVAPHRIDPAALRTAPDDPAMIRRPLAAIALAAALSACTAHEAQVPQGTSPRYASLDAVASGAGRSAAPAERAATPVAVLPAWIGRPVRLRERADGDTFEQAVSLALAPRTETRENLVLVAVFPSEAGATRGEDGVASAMGRPTEVGIRTEIAAAFPDMAMEVVTRPAANAYGPYGLAVGRRPGGARCLYAWQWIADAPAITGIRSEPVSLRVRLCRDDITLDAMAAAVNQIRLVPRFAGEVVAAVPRTAVRPARRRPAQRIAVVRHRIATQADAAMPSRGEGRRPQPSRTFAEAPAERSGPRYLGEDAGPAAAMRPAAPAPIEAGSLRRMTAGGGATDPPAAALGADLPPEAYRGPAAPRP